jgi:hypothetical protein
LVDLHGLIGPDQILRRLDLESLSDCAAEDGAHSRHWIGNLRLRAVGRQLICEEHSEALGDIRVGPLFWR